MSKESIQKKLGRVRPPRVHITYDVETGGAIVKRDIPFVAGVLADLSGMPEKALPPMSQRKFVDIDRDNFDQVLAKTAPRLAFKVDNRLSEDDTKLGVELRFNKLDDFGPAAVAKQVPALRKLLELRNSLQNLRSSLIGNDKLESMLQEVLTNTEALQRIGAEAGSGESGKKKEE
jgi:type VI secretion system protein ImpB